MDLGLTFNPQTQPTKILSITFSFTIYSLIVVDRFEAKNTDYHTLFSGLLILAHQALTGAGGWFELDQFLHHENIAAVIIAFACGILFCLETKKYL